MWVYIESEPHLYTVGFYDPDGRFHADSDHTSRDEAAARVSYLNGGNNDLSERVAVLEDQVEQLEIKAK